MILFGVKKEEYREIKDYYNVRFANQLNVSKGLLSEYIKQNECLLDIKFRNGYSEKSPSFVAKCRLKIGQGREEWGAEKDKEYYVLEVLGIKKE